MSPRKLRCVALASGIAAILVAGALLLGTAGGGALVSPAAALARRLGYEGVPLQQKKTVSDDTVRVVFVAGLVGSGHAALEPVFERCGDFCQSPKDLQRILYWKGSCRAFNPWRCKHPGAWYNATGVAKGVLERAAADLKKKQGGGIILINSKDARLPYPIDWSMSLSRPDVRWLAEVAEALGLDARFLVLLAPAGQAMAAMEEGEALKDLRRTHRGLSVLDNIMALSTQVRAIDPAFYTCLDLTGQEKLSAKQVEDVARFLHPQFLGSQKETWAKMAFGEARVALASQTGVAVETKDPILGNQLQAAVAQLAAACAGYVRL